MKGHVTLGSPFTCTISKYLTQSALPLTPHTHSLTPSSPHTRETTYVELKRRIGMGAHVKKTERRRKDFRPQASERAPIRGAERKERIPYGSV